MTSITTHEQAQASEANASGNPPVVFVHGLWLLPSSWNPWRGFCESAGYSTVAPGWPDDPETVAEAKAHPEVFAGKSIDSGWREVAQTALDFIERFVHPGAAKAPDREMAAVG
jgi:hypothetical protein